MAGAAAGVRLCSVGQCSVPVLTASRKAEKAAAGTASVVRRVHILAYDAVALIDSETGLAIDLDGLGVVLVGPLDDDERRVSAACASTMKGTTWTVTSNSRAARVMRRSCSRSTSGPPTCWRITTYQ